MAVPTALAELVAQQLQQFGIVIDDQQPFAAASAMACAWLFAPYGRLAGNAPASRVFRLWRWFSLNQESGWCCNGSGFVMPLAMTLSAVLLLVRLDPHAFLQVIGAIRPACKGSSARSAPVRGSAFVAGARAAEACLLLQSSDQWHQPSSDCLHADPDRLRQGRVNDQIWQLVAWRADHDSGQLDLRLADGRAARFQLQLDPAAPAVVAVSQAQLLGRVQARGAA